MCERVSACVCVCVCMCVCERGPGVGNEAKKNDGERERMCTRWPANSACVVFKGRDTMCLSTTNTKQGKLTLLCRTFLFLEFAVWGRFRVLSLTGGRGEIARGRKGRIVADADFGRRDFVDLYCRKRCAVSAHLITSPKLSQSNRGAQ